MAKEILHNGRKFIKRRMPSSIRPKMKRRKTFFTYLTGNEAFSYSENPIIALFTLLYVEGLEDERFFRVLEQFVDDGDSFIFKIGNREYKYTPEVAREFRRVCEEIDNDMPNDSYSYANQKNFD